MATLQELRKRLRSIQSTQQLASAMRTASTVKFSKVNRIHGNFGPYAKACRDMLAHLGSAGIPRETEDVSSRDAVVVFSGNRGLCGAFNTELFRFLDQTLADMDSPLLLASGRKAASHLRELGRVYEEFPLPDVPDYQDIKPLANRIRSLYTSGQANRVLAVYQHYENTLIQKPQLRQLLPESGIPEGRDDASLLYFPDRATIGAQLAVSCLDAQVFDLAMENASGAQAETLVAMSSACDNAEATAADLEITINRRRQAEVTASVLETATGNLQQGE